MSASLPAPVVDTVGTPALLRTLADPLRWQILHLLAGEQLCTTHLVEALGAAQSLVSHHLGVLRQAGLVRAEPCGRYTYYRLVPGALDRLCETVGALARASSAPVRRRPC